MYQNSLTGDCNSCHIRSECAFKYLPGDTIARLNEHRRSCTFTRGETIFGLGDEATHFYCVRSGRLQVYRSSPCREQSFQIARAGDWMGYRDALAGGVYQHGVRCLSEATVCKFPRSVLDECMQDSPAFSRALMSELADGWIQSEHQSYNLGSRKIMERLADYLLNLNEQSGEKNQENQEAQESHEGAHASEPANNPPTVDFYLTREMLATLLGTTTESVIRTLSDFKARGWIDLDRSKVRLTNEKELARLVAES
ncbi:MAG: Crp/Fnr family transcriptional regulator [bacterium]|nr:Crp/Fnr family transcriptional regulator [bacterium]